MSDRVLALAPTLYRLLELETDIRHRPSGAVWTPRQMVALLYATARTAQHPEDLTEARRGD